MVLDVARGDQRPVALVVLSGGGFLFETKCLLTGIGGDFDFIYLTTELCGRSGICETPARHNI